jgi:hypothetical protein
MQIPGGDQYVAEYFNMLMMNAVFVVIVKKTFRMETFFSTTTYAPIP